jgi:hypothetical protein
MRVVLRVNNDVLCNLAAIIAVDDTAAMPPVAAFSHLAFLPGLSVAHPGIVWDAPSRLFWMVSNLNRDALRPWNAAAEASPCVPCRSALTGTSNRDSLGCRSSETCTCTTSSLDTTRLPAGAAAVTVMSCVMLSVIFEACNGCATAGANKRARYRHRARQIVQRCRGFPRLEMPLNSSCEIDRSTLALHYSPDLAHWTEAGLVDYTLALHRHVTYPSMLVDGDDLLVVARAAIGGDGIHP